MSVGRTSNSLGRRAVVVLNLYSLPPDAALKEMLQSDVLHSIKVIELPAAGEMTPRM